MAVVITLSELHKLGVDDVGSGVAESIINVNPLFQVMPWNVINGNAYTFNVEDTMGGAATLDRKSVAAGLQGGGLDIPSSAKTPSTFTKVTQSLVPFVAQVEIAGIDVATSAGANAGANPVAIQIASRAKQIGQLYQQMMMTGTAGNTSFEGLEGYFQDNMTGGPLGLLSQTVTGTGGFDEDGGSVFTLRDLDELLDMVTASQPDFILAPAHHIRRIRELAASLGGTSNRDVTGAVYDEWRGVRIYRNDYANGIYAGCFDDGSRTLGMSGVISSAGQLQVENLGKSQVADTYIHRITMYAGFAVHSPKSIAKLSASAKPVDPTYTP